MSKTNVIRYTPEQIAEVDKLLSEKTSHQKIIDLTGVGKGTIAKRSAKLKKGDGGTTTKKSTTKTPDYITATYAELDKITTRILVVEEQLNGSLKRELEELTIKKSTLEKVVELYQNQTQ